MTYKESGEAIFVGLAIVEQAYLFLNTLVPTVKLVPDHSCLGTHKCSQSFASVFLLNLNPEAMELELIRSSLKWGLIIVFWFEKAIEFALGTNLV